jgi:ABC-type glycerol-3-phosphate transport system substrate-binding protein
MVVSTSSKNPELAVKLMSFINSKAESLELQKFQPKVTLRKDITEAELKYAPGSISSKLLGYSKNYVYFVDNILTPGVVDEFYKYTPLALVGKMTPKQVADMMDKKAAENAAAAKK